MAEGILLKMAHGLESVLPISPATGKESRGNTFPTGRLREEAAPMKRQDGPLKPNLTGVMVMMDDRGDQLPS